MPTQTLVISYADIEGMSHGSLSSRTRVEVDVSYTGEISLTDGRVVPRAIKRRLLPVDGEVEFEVYASDSPDVLSEYRGFGIQVRAVGEAGHGRRRDWTSTRTVKVLTAAGDPVKFGLLAPAENVASTGFVSASDVIAAAQQAAVAADAAATRAENAEAAALGVPDASVSALIGNPATQTRTALDDLLTGVVPNASTTTPGKVELATAAETATGTDAARAVTPAGVKPLLDAKANATDTYTKTEVDTLVDDAGGGSVEGFYHVAQWGAKGDGATDDIAAIEAAFEETPIGAILHLGTRHFCSRTPVLKRAIRVVGGAGSAGSPQILTPTGVTCFQVAKHATYGAPHGYVLDHVLVEQTPAPTAKATSGGHGFEFLDGIGELYGTRARNVAGDGHTWQATVAQGRNVCNVTAYSPHSHSCWGDAFKITGDNAQKIKVFAPDAWDFHGWGINVDSTAANSFIDPHLDPALDCAGLIRDNGNTTSLLGHLYYEWTGSGNGDLVSLEAGSRAFKMEVGGYNPRPRIVDNSTAKNAMIVDRDRDVLVKAVTQDQYDALPATARTNTRTTYLIRPAVGVPLYTEQPAAATAAANFIYNPAAVSTGRAWEKSGAGTALTYLTNVDMSGLTTAARLTASGVDARLSTKAFDGANVPTSFVVKATVLAEQIQGVSLAVEQYDASYAYLGIDSGPTVEVPRNTPTRLSASFTKKAGADNFTVFVIAWTMSGAIVANAMHLGPDVEYFSGATPDTTRFDYGWAGTAHNSKSTRTPK